MRNGLTVGRPVGRLESAVHVEYVVMYRKQLDMEQNATTQLHHK